MMRVMHTFPEPDIAVRSEESAAVNSALLFTLDRNYCTLLRAVTLDDTL